MEQRSMLDHPTLDPDDSPRREHQIHLEKLYNKNQTLQRVRQEFEESDLDWVGYFKQQHIDEEFGFSLLVQMALHKRATFPTMVGILRHHYEPSKNASQLAADMLHKCVLADLVDWSPVTEQFIVRYTVTEDVQHDLDRYQYPLPMVVPPKMVRDNSDTGYFTSRNSIILRKNHHEDDVCLDHINKVNRIKFVINDDVATMIANRWKNLDKPKVGETKDDFQRRIKAFAKYDRTAKEVIRLICAYGKEFYLTHKYDKRGRIYCQGYHINYQGAPWNKAVIELAQKELVE